jgi:phosphate transport system permease protein
VAEAETASIETPPMPEQDLGGQRRRRVTRRGVRLAERLARLLISIGGIGTIVAVTLILVFLAWVVTPLFMGARMEARGAPVATAAASARNVLQVGLDPRGAAAWALYDDGSVQTWRLSDGAQLERRSLGIPRLLTASALLPSGDELALGFADGSLRTCAIAFDADDGTARDGTAPATGTMPPGAIAPGAMPRLTIRMSEPIETGSSRPIVRVDRSPLNSRERLCALDDANQLFLIELERTENMLTGEVTATASHFAIPFETQPGAPVPNHVLIAGNGGSLFVAWKSGHLVRYDVRDPEHARVAEDVELCTPGNELTSLCFLIGKSTLISGDSNGRLRAWFCTKPSAPHALADAPRTCDGATLVMAHELSEKGPAVTALAPSARSRVVAAGLADGALALYHVTSHKLLAEARVDVHAGDEEPASAASGPRSFIERIAVAPKEDGVVALGAGRVTRWSLDLRHPEASISSLFAPVWYEGYEKPTHAWQSTSGTDDFEPKLGLIPLVFGTIKATFYSMLFGLPIALLAAIYTSEFLNPRLRAPLKSLTEMMASLPSVVLGFIAALVIAPFVQKFIPAVITSFVTIPGALLLGAHLWQLLPQRIALRFHGAPRFALMAIALPLGALAAFALGGSVERALFAGDIQAWLDRHAGRALGGWVLLLLPVSILAVVLFSTRVVDPSLRRVSAAWSRGRCARVDLVKFALGAACAIGLALGAGLVLDGLWLDPRGGVLDTYVQRNALVVGFVMGFAVIPVVYTLAEDALSSVPHHLRLASLGAGATPWQTAVRVVIPTAMSGLFSAAMIGLGRAVGETMIVLMATGNTPVMSWNVFNGFRTLSANLATELPEAVRNSTHYRTLFLAALCLFAMTFAFNTLAEVVRQRFRKRAYQL